MTLPILILPVPIYQGPPVPTNKTNIWPFPYATPSLPNATPSLPNLKLNTTNSSVITSRSSRIYTLPTKSSIPSKITGFTYKGTEQNEIETSTPLDPIDIHVKGLVNSVDVNQPLYTTPAIISLKTDSEKPISIVSINTPEATTPTTIIFPSVSRSSSFVSNVTEEENVATTKSQRKRLNVTVTEFTGSARSSKTNAYTTPAFVTTTEFTTEIPTINSTNPSQPLSLFTLWTEPTDSTQNPSSDFPLNITEQIETTTTPLESKSTHANTPELTETIENSQFSLYTTRQVSNNKIPTRVVILPANPSESTPYDQSISTLSPASDVSRLTDETTATSFEVTNTYKDVTESSQPVDSGPTKLYTISSVSPSTVSKNKEPSIFYTSTNVYVVPTENVSTTESPDAGHSPIFLTLSWNVTDFGEVEISTPSHITTVNVTDSTNSGKVRQAKLYTISSITSTTVPNNKEPSTIFSTNLHEATTEKVTVNINVSDPTSGESGQTNFYTASSVAFTTDPNHLKTDTTRGYNITEQIKVGPTTPLETTTHNNEITRTTESDVFSNPTISSDQLKTDREDTEFLTTSINPLFSTIISIIESGELSTVTENFFNEISTEPLSNFTDSTPYTIAENGTIEYMSTILASSSEFKTSTNNFISSSMTTSSVVAPTVTTDIPQSEPQVNPSALIISSYSQNSSYPVYTSTEVESTTIPNRIENISREFTSTERYTTEENLSTPELSNREFITSTQYILTEVTSQSSPSQYISTTDTAPRTDTTVELSSSSDFIETTNSITTETSTSSTPFLTTLKYSPLGHTNSTSWEPVTLPSSISNLMSTTDLTTTIPITTVSPCPSEVNIREKTDFTSNMPSTFHQRITEPTENIAESLSTTIEPFATIDRSIVTVEPEISTTEPIIHIENTDTKLYTLKPSVPKEFKSTQSATSINKSMTTSTERTKTNPVVAKIVRTLPPLPYSPPPCYFSITTQKSTKSAEMLPIILPSSSTSIPSSEPESPTLSQPLGLVCGFWDKFQFPDQNDCTTYYECSFGRIKKYSCEYGYDFNPYALVRIICLYFFFYHASRFV